MGHQLTILDEGDGRLAIYLRRAGQEFPERAGEPFPFAFPLTEQERADLRWYLEDYLQAPYAVWEDRGQTIAHKLVSWGESLFQAVFGNVKTHAAYTKAREGAGGAELVIHSNNPTLLGLPWELLKDPDRPTPLALDADFAAIDRTFDVEGAATEVSPGESLRVLMVIARPAGIRDVGYQMIARPLLERLQAVRGRMKLEVLRPPTIDTLEDRLKRAADDGRPYQVLHFDGHGVLQRRTGAGFALGTVPRDRYRTEGEGYVVFEKATGGDEAVAADHFARLVRAGRVPLVVLNACQSGAMIESAEAAVATRLLLEGAASVVAMGYSVYAVAAAEFMTAFYQALFDGKTVSAAVNAGRDRLARKPDRPSPKGLLPLEDWMVPVHYQRRAISFPQLKPTPARPDLSLDTKLDQLRQAAKLETIAAAAVVQSEGSIEPVGRFVGRDSFLYTLERACRHHRVVLVHGPGGTGKTELAKAFARWWRDTDGLDDPTWVFFHSFEPGLPSFGLDGVINALGIRRFGPDFIGRTEGQQQRQALMLETLRQHRMLLIWDNFESVYSMANPGGATPPLSPEQRNEIAAFLAAFRREGFGSALIVTSRTEEEWLGDVRRVELGGLSPQEAAEYADALLAGYPRAQAQRQVKAFGELMEWLAGHPLSLKLILPHLEESPAAALLAGLRGMGELPEGFETAGRLKSLGASVQYSLDHLPEDVCRLLPVLSLFEGVADEQVLAVFSTVAEVPTQFAGRSRAVWQEALQAAARVGLLTPLGDGQYVLHPALPSYLAVQWRREANQGFEGERQMARRALLTVYADLGGWLGQQIQTGSAEMAVAQIERQRRTMGQLLAFALSEERYREAQKVMQPLGAFWNVRGLAEEAKGWVDRVRQAVEGAAGAAPDFDGEAGGLWLFAVTDEANWAIRSGDLAKADKAYNDIRRTLEAVPAGEQRDRDLATVYFSLGNVAHSRGDLAPAENWSKKSLALFDALGDRLRTAYNYHQLGIIAQDRHDLVAAESWYMKALTIREALGDRPGMAATYNQLGMVALERDDPAAENWHMKSLAIYDALGDRRGMAGSYHQLGMVAANWVPHQAGMVAALRGHRQLDMMAQLRGNLAAAENWHMKSLALFDALGDRQGMAHNYRQLGMVATFRGNLAAAENWHMKSLAIYDALGDRQGMAHNYGLLSQLAEAHEDLAAALDWMVRCVALFADFPHPSAGLDPHELGRLTRIRGMAALQESWQRCIGRPLPAHVRTAVERMIGAAGSTEG